MSDERRQQIVDAARQLYEEQGLSATTVKDISERCGVARSLFYPKSTDIPYRPSKAPGITRCTTLLMIAYGDAGCAGCGGGGSEGAASSSIPIGANLQCFGVMFNVF